MRSRSLSSPQFQSTPLIRGATVLFHLENLRKLFQSTPLIRGATLRRHRCRRRARYFNPRPSYEERQDDATMTDHALLISIHAPHTRSDSLNSSLMSAPRYFNPRPSYEERPSHANVNPLPSAFQSTPLIRGATRVLNELDTGYERAKNQILMAYVAAVMAEDTDTQTSLKTQLKSLDADYDEKRKE